MWLTVLFATIALIQNTNSSAKIKMFFYWKINTHIDILSILHFWVCADSNYSGWVKWNEIFVLRNIFGFIVVIFLNILLSVGAFQVKQIIQHLKITDNQRQTTSSPWTFQSWRCHKKSIFFRMKWIQKYVNSFPYQFPCLFYHIICVISVSSIQH